MAPYVASPMSVVRKMLESAELKPGETLYDLGSGDGRIAIMAAQEFGANGVGVDLNVNLVREARAKAEELHLGERVKIIHGNLLEVDLRQADVVTMYLTTGANDKVRPKLEQELKAWSPGRDPRLHDSEVESGRHYQVQGRLPNTHDISLSMAAEGFMNSIRHHDLALIA